MIGCGSASLNEEAVTQGKAKAKMQGRSDIVFKHNDGFNLSAFASQKAEVLVSSGLFDILTEEEQIKTVLKNGSAITQPGARWVFTIEENHPDLKLLQESLIDLNQKPWKLVLRPAQQLIDWAKPYG